MQPTVHIDTTLIDRAMNDMVRLTGISREDWIKVEGGAILDKCILWTKMATISKINANAARAARKIVNRSGDRTAYLTHAGIIWVYSRKSNRYLKAGQFNQQANTGTVNRNAMGRPIGTSLVDDARKALRAARRTGTEYADKAKKARGLAVQSWVQIADISRVVIKPTKKTVVARKAVATTGIFYRNGSGKWNTNKNRMVLTMTNRLPYNTAIGMQGMFQRAMSGRVKYFEQNIKRGVFKDMQKVAARYPGLRAVA